MNADPVANNVLVEALASSLRRGGNSLADVPGLLERVLAEESWRHFVTRRGEPVDHERFSEFVTTPPLKGLGATDELIDRIAEPSKYPRLARQLREVRKVGRGKRTDLRPSGKSPLGHGSHDTSYQAERLAREAPEEYAAVERGERTLHAAAIRAGIRKRCISIQIDSAESAAQSLRKHMSPDTRRALVKLLMDD